MQNRHVLLITVDSLRYDHLGPEYDNDLAPRVSELASQGVKFEQTIANGPNTRTSFPSILTSTYPVHYGGYSFLSEDRPFIAQVFRNAGYETAGYHSNPHLGRDQNYHTGFGVFNDEAEASESVASLKDRVERRLDPDSWLYSLLRTLWHRYTMTTGSSAYAKADTISDNAVEWLHSREGDDPFFVWLHYMDVHYPFTPPNEHLKEIGVDPYSDGRVAELNGKMHEQPEDLTEQDLAALRDLYCGEIRYVDAEIGRVLDELKQCGLADKTVVALTADHGEAFGEHGIYGHEPSLYDEFLRVPLVMSIPDRGPERIDRQVPLLDLGPTLLDLTGLEASAEMDGRSVFEDTSERTVVSAAKTGDILSARTKEWKYIWKIPQDSAELYDLTTNPAETTDISDDHPDVVSRLRAELKSHRERARQKDSDLPHVDTSKSTEQRLRELGYME